MTRRFLVGSLALGCVGGAAACGGAPDTEVGYIPLPTSGSSGAGGSSSASGGSSGSDGSGSGSQSSGAGAGAGGAAATCPPAGPFNGPVIDAKEKEWTWIDVPEALCRDGSKTGFGVRLNPASDKVLIYLEGGGACFNGTTCGASLSSFGEIAFTGWQGTAGNTGVFSMDNPDNPLRDWSAIYIPYCTGDIHGGGADHVDIPGFGNPKNQSFLGYKNVGHVLERVVPTFSSASQVVLTGISAGGFGAAYNYDRVAEAFCPTPVTLIDDSGPPMADKYLAPCLQKQWKGLWGLDNTLPSGCPECNGADGGGIVNYAKYIGTKYPNSRLALISSAQDSVISLFFGFGANDCSGIATPLSGDEYKAGLEDLRDNYMSASGMWATYYVTSMSHTYLIGPAFYTTTVDGKKLTDWVGDVVDGKQAGHIGP